MSCGAGLANRLLQKVLDADVSLAHLDIVIMKSRLELAKCRKEALQLKKELLELSLKAQKIVEELEFPETARRNEEMEAFSASHSVSSSVGLREKGEA